MRSKEPRTANSVSTSCARGYAALSCCLVCLLIVGTLGCQTSATGYNIDGVRSYQTGNFPQALQDFQQALQVDAANPDAYYNLAATYHELGRQNRDPALMQQAEGLYHQCLDLSPNHAECYRGLAALLVQTDRAQSAFTLLQRWSERNYQSADARIELARLYEEFGDQQSAVRYLTEALEVDSKSPRAWTALGRIREQQGQLAQALSNYQQAYAINTFQPGVAERIATLQRSLSTSAGSVGNGGTQMVTIPTVPVQR